MPEAPSKHPPISTDRAAERRATAIAFYRRSEETDDPISRKIFEGVAVTYYQLADEIDRAAEVVKRIDAQTKTVKSTSGGVVFTPPVLLEGDLPK